MHRKQIFASLASLLLAPLAAATNGGHINLAQGEGPRGGERFQDKGNILADPPKTGQCPSLPLAIDLGTGGSEGSSLLRVTINGSPFYLAISLELDDAWVFGSALCAQVVDSAIGPADTTFGKDREAYTDAGHCYLGTQVRPSQRLDQPTIHMGVDRFETTDLEHIAHVFIGEEGRMLDLGAEYPLRVVESVNEYHTTDGLVNNNLNQTIRRFVKDFPKAQGVIGLGRNSVLLQKVFEVCGSRDPENQLAGFGIHYKAGPNLVFGGLDVNGTNLKQNDPLEGTHAFEMTMSPSAKFTLPPNLKVMFDPALPHNVVPYDLSPIIGGFGTSERITLKLENASFDVDRMSIFAHPRDISSEGINENILILGQPFFTNAYIARPPGGQPRISPQNPNDTGVKLVKFTELGKPDNDDDDTNAEDSDSESTINVGGGDGASPPRKSEGEPAESKSSSGPPIGAIVGGVIGGIAFLVIVGLAVWLCRRRKSRGTSRSIEKEYEADFDHEMGHDAGMLPHFTKETGYASIPTPPPPPPQMFQPQPYTGYAATGAAPLAIQRYSDDSPTQSHSSSPTYVEPPPSLPLPVPLSTTTSHTGTSLQTPQTASERRASLTTISTDISPMVSRNVSTVSRRDYPTISQVQHKNTSRSVLPEDDEDEDDDDIVSVTSGAAYQRVHTSTPSNGGSGGGSASAAPRLPFARTSPDSERGERSGL